MTDITGMVDVKWEDVSGEMVLRAEGNQYLAVPCNGRRSSALFDIIDIENSVHLCQVSREEVRPWLCTMVRDARKG